MEIKKIAEAMLNPTPQREILESVKTFTLIINSETSSAYIDNSGALVAFLSEDEASLYANKHHCANSIVKNVSDEELKAHSGKIKVYSFVPLCLEITPEFLGVSEAIAVFNTYENNARRKLDRCEEFLNIHTLVKRLVFQNEIEPEFLDKKLGLPNGYTKNFFLINNSSPSMDIVLKYLSYFGLEKYLYLFKNDSKEIQQYITRRLKIDKYKLKKADVKKEVFTLEKLSRGSDDKGFYVYKLYLVNDWRKIDFVASSPFNCIVGKKYSIEGLQPLATGDLVETRHCLPDVPTMEADAEQSEKKQREQRKTAKQRRL